MSMDAMISRELASLRQELSRQRQATEGTPAGVRPEPSGPAAAAADASPGREDDAEAGLRALADEVEAFLSEAGKNVAAHPASSVAGAFVLGILVGRLIGR